MLLVEAIGEKGTGQAVLIVRTHRRLHTGESVNRRGREDRFWTTLLHGRALTDPCACEPWTGTGLAASGPTIALACGGSAEGTVMEEPRSEAICPTVPAAGPRMRAVIEPERQSFP